MDPHRAPRGVDVDKGIRDYGHLSEEIPRATARLTQVRQLQKLRARARRNPI